MTKSIFSLFRGKKHNVPETDDAQLVAERAMNVRLQRILDAATAKNG
jgi:hypothetical protein